MLKQSKVNGTALILICVYSFSCLISGFAVIKTVFRHKSRCSANGLIRQYVPKGSEIRTLTDDQIQHIMDRLNNRPRKSLGFLTPNEVFYKRRRLTG